MLRALGQVDLLIVKLCDFLSVIGALMLRESLHAIRETRKGRPIRVRRPGNIAGFYACLCACGFASRGLHQHYSPLLIGFLVGMLSAIMGVGGGFIMVPAMIYLLRMPTNVVIGTSLFQIIFVTSAVTVLHAVENQTVDIVLAVLLMIGGVIGAQFGAMAGQRLRGEELRALLALIVLGVACKLILNLVFEPTELFSIQRLGVEP